MGMGGEQLCGVEEKHGHGVKAQLQQQKNEKREVAGNTEVLEKGFRKGWKESGIQTANKEEDGRPRSKRQRRPRTGGGSTRQAGRREKAAHRWPTRRRKGNS